MPRLVHHTSDSNDQGLRPLNGALAPSGMPINCNKKGHILGKYETRKELVGQRVRIQPNERAIRTRCIEAVTVAADAPRCKVYGAEPRARYEAQGRSLSVPRQARGRS